MPIIRVSNDIYEAILERKHRMMSVDDVLRHIFADCDIEPFNEEFEDEEEDDDG